MSNSLAKVARLCCFLSFSAMLLGAPLRAAEPPAGAAAKAPASPATPATPAADPAVRLYVQDGQLGSHPFSVLVTDRIDDTMQPTLRLTGSHWVLRALPLEQEALKPLFVAPRQTRTVQVAGQQVAVEGTLLMFDLSKYSLGFGKSAVRLLPRLEWTVPAPAMGQPPMKRVVVAEQEIYLGNMAGGVLWTAVIMLLITAAFLVWSASKSKNVTGFKPRPVLLLITGPDGYLSLWRAQLIIWTYAVGSLVFLFGLLRLKVPEIPDSLVALMGMSLLTGLTAKKGQSPAPPSGQGSGGTTTASQGQGAAGATAPAQAPVANPGQAEWGDLISTWDERTLQVGLSIPKAQMVLWTALIVTLFCVKSVLEGALWAVPWEIVALTGFSQAGYVGDKFVTGKP